MIGRRSGQLGLFDGDHLWLDHVGRDSFYGFLALHRAFLFSDQDFASMFAPAGRPSVPPTLLATALVLQRHDGVGDDEARDRACFDARWKVALGVEMEARPFSTSTLRAFRHQVQATPAARHALERALAYVRTHGYAVGVAGPAERLSAVEDRPPPARAPDPAAGERPVLRIAVTEAAW